MVVLLPPHLTNFKTLATTYKKFPQMRFITALLLVAFLCVKTTSGQSKEVKWLVDTSIAVMKSNAVNRDKVDWSKIEKNVYSQIATKQNAYELGPAFRTLFKSLND